VIADTDCAVLVELACAVLVELACAVLVDVDGIVVIPFVFDDVLLELSAKESEKAYCGKIKIAESKRGIKNFVFISSSHRD
jgi:hypothetical protein